MNNSRKTQLSVTNFLFCGDDYLFQLRSPNSKINAGELNGIGGKLEPSEDYVTAAIRETEEETGYKIKPSDVQFCGIIKFEGGYAEDWVTCFYKIKVPHKDIPIGNKTREGELLWIHKDEVLDSGYKLVDDLYYCFGDIAIGNSLFFITAEVGGQDLSIVNASVHRLDK
jgi:8-oxo-dGTP pyrophosphatase MutT (NUDIX family)